MMVLTIKEVRKHLQTLIQFLEPVHSLAGSHFGSFFTKQLWENEIPINIQSELNNVVSINNFIQLYPQIIRNNCSDEFAQSHPNLITFLETAMSVSVNKGERYQKSLLDLENLCLTKGYTRTSDIEMEEFMSPKKLHEVKITSKMAALLSDITESSHIVDIGGGKGYLSCILALLYSFKVLGLDSSEVTTCGAAKRSQKVAKLWTGDIFKHSQSEEFGKIKNTKKSREDFIQNHYKQFITYVKPDTDVEELLKEGFSEEISGIVLTGLHTCGDLAPTSLQMFLKNKKIKGILNVGCCYHLLSEECDSESLENTSEIYGFPLSSFLKDEKYWLGRNARMLAAHSLDRINSDLNSEAKPSDFGEAVAVHGFSLNTNLSFSFNVLNVFKADQSFSKLLNKKERKTENIILSQTSIFYRAILETVILERAGKIPPQQQVGRLAKKCSTFHEYMFRALKKFDINVQLSEKDLDKLYEKYESKKQLLTAYYLLRISLAPVVESIILLDRILYLMENGVSNAYLVPLFNLMISPRGFGIIAWKDYDKN